MKKLLFAILLLLFYAPAWAATRYVDGTLGANCTGDYSIAARTCTGADGNAYTTLTAGASVLTAGDTLYVRAGTYSETGGTFQMPSGTLGSPITVSGYQAEVVTLTTVPWHYYGIAQDGTSYVTVTKFVYSGNSSGIYLGHGGGHTPPHDMTVSYSEVANIGDVGGGAVKGEGENNTYSHLTVHDVGATTYDSAFYITGGSGHILENNNIYSSCGAGIHIRSSLGVHAGGMTIRNNYIHDTSGGVSESRGCEAATYGRIQGIVVWDNSDNNLIYNNVIANMSQTPDSSTVPGRGAITIFDNGTGNKVYNNTIYNIYHADGIQIGSATQTNAVVRNNIVYQTTGGIYDVGSSSTVSNNLTTNPVFVDEYNYDFHLQSSSTAIGGGYNLYSIFTDDYAGTARPTSPTAWDIGAYVYEAPAEPHDSPTVLTTSCTAMGATSAQCVGNITDDKGGTIDGCGMCYATTAAPTTPCTDDDGCTATGPFTVDIPNLQVCSLYSIRSWGSNDNATSGYGGDAQIKPRGLAATGDWTNVTTTSAITVDATSFDAAASPLTIAHTIAADANYITAVIAGASSATVTSIAWNTSENLARIKRQLSDAYWVETWQLANPTTGTHNVVATTSADSIYLSITSWKGVGTADPIGTAVSAAGSSSPISVNVTSSAGQIVVDGVIIGAVTTATAGAGQTQLHNQNPYLTQASSYKDGASAMSWTFTGGASYAAIVAVPLKPGTVASDVWYMPAANIPTRVKDASGNILTPVAAVEGVCTLTESQTWCANGTNLYVQVTGGGNPGAVNIQCTAPPTNLMMGFW